MNLKLKMRLLAPDKHSEKVSRVPLPYRRTMLVVASAEDLDTGRVVYEVCHLWLFYEMAKNDVLYWAARMGHHVYAAKDHLSAVLDGIKTLLIAPAVVRGVRLSVNIPE